MTIVLKKQVKANMLVYKNQASNKFADSIFRVEPNTNYKIFHKMFINPLSPKLFKNFYTPCI
jgi:hypothetical protein